MASRSRRCGGLDLSSRLAAEVADVGETLGASFHIHRVWSRIMSFRELLNFEQRRHRPPKKNTTSVRLVFRRAFGGAAQSTDTDA